MNSKTICDHSVLVVQISNLLKNTHTDTDLCLSVMFDDLRTQTRILEQNLTSVRSCVWRLSCSRIVRKLSSRGWSALRCCWNLFSFFYYLITLYAFKYIVIRIYVYLTVILSSYERFLKCILSYVSSLKTCGIVKKIKNRQQLMFNINFV
jgi:hypothetical protein